MKYFFFDQETLGETVRHITCEISHDCWVVFPDVESNTGPERIEYLQWVAQGNTAREFVQNDPAD